MTHERHRREEILEIVWTSREKGVDRLEEVIGSAGFGESHPLIEEMVEEGLLLLDGGAVRFTEEGERRARQVIRRHRLAERLFADVFGLAEAPMESGACEFEHILSREVTESVCAFLGHPSRCPHNRPIPPGECCLKRSAEVRPLVTTLRRLNPGDAGRITYIASRNGAELDRLGSLGVVPGSTVRLRQRHPSFVVEVGETLIALDGEIADEIYVRRFDDATSAGSKY
jgi:DtxR family Mn-dependent transcriptional regulator